jgi:nucleotide-binding universal stress UspA family protein
MTNRSISCHSGNMYRIKHLLLATDLTERSQRAFERAIQLKSELGAAVTLLHALEPGLFPAIGEERYADAEGLLRTLIAELPEDKRAGVACDIRVGEPFTAIIDEADKYNAELIIVGQPAKGGLKELFIGTTTERVVLHSDLPVLVVNEPVRGAYSHVMVAMDLSEGAIRALETAYRIAPEAEFLIVHAWHVPLMAFGTTDAAERVAIRKSKRVRERVDRRFKEFLSELAPHAKAPRIELLEGSPQVEIRSQMAVFNPDLLAMGTHARSAMKTAMIGSLSREFLAEARCDMLVAHA